MSQVLTPGQLRIREIICELLPEYKRLNTIDEFRSFRTHIKARFSEDLIINADPCVCQSLGKSEKIAKPYLDWLYEMSLSSDNLVTIENGEYLVNLDRPVFIFSSEFERHKKRAYEGGEKDYTTYQALFTFAENKGHEIQRADWNLLYYEEDGILKVSGGGNNRTLACVLWGNDLIAPQTFYVVKNLSDPDLHKALLMMQSYLKDTNLSFNIYHRCESKQLQGESRNNLLYEALKIKEFVTEATPEEIDIIIKFLCYEVRYNSHEHGRKETVVISQFLQILREYRGVVSRNLVQRIIAKITRNSKASTGELSLFEQWIFKNYDVYQ